MTNMIQEEAILKKTILKEDIKTTAGKLIKVLLVLSIIGQIGVLAVTALIGQIPVNFGFSDGVKDFLKTALPVIIFNVLVIAMATKSTKLSIKKDMICKNEGNSRFTTFAFIFCVFVGMIGAIFTLVVASMLRSNGFNPPAPNFDFSQNNIMGMVLNLGYTCLLAPVFEEIIFRGFILKNMQKYGNLTAVIVSSVLFGMNHLNLMQLIPTTLIGIVLSIITIKSRSIIPAIITHIANNIIAATITFLGAISVEILSIFVMVLMFVIILGSLVFIIVYRKEVAKILKDNNTILRTSQKVKASFRGGWAIAYIAFWAAMILTGIIG